MERGARGPQQPHAGSSERQGRQLTLWGRTSGSLIRKGGDSQEEGSQKKTQVTHNHAAGFAKLFGARERATPEEKG
eukprot:7109206-Heterocapsa_arctica.AAC.1